MAVPFCTACGATLAEGTRFCVKCGQAVGQAAAPSSVTQTVVSTPPAVPTAASFPPVVPASAPPIPVAARPVGTTPVWAPPPPPPPPVMPLPVVQPVKDGPGAGLWIGIFGILLLLGGAGLWFYTRGQGAVSTVQVTAGPTEGAPAPTSAPTPAPPAPVSAPAPVPQAAAPPEVIPPNPDFSRKDAEAPEAPRPMRQVRPQVAQSSPPVQVPDPGPAQPVRAARQTSGQLHASVEVAQNGEVVFENLPGARLKFTFDHDLWRPTISRQANGTQTLVMRSLKAGIQRTCDVRWEIVE